MKTLFNQAIPLTVLFTVVLIFSISTEGVTSEQSPKRGKGAMTIHLKTEDISEFELNVGDTIYLESLRQSVVPPYLMIIPFIQLPESLILKETLPLEEDGVHGAIFVLEAKLPGKNKLTVGFKDLQYETVTHEKVIYCTSHKM